MKTNTQFFIDYIIKKLVRNSLLIVSVSALLFTDFKFESIENEVLIYMLVFIQLNIHLIVLSIPRNYKKFNNDNRKFATIILMTLFKFLPKRNKVLFIGDNSYKDLTDLNYIMVKNELEDRGIKIINDTKLSRQKHDKRSFIANIRYIYRLCTYRKIICVDYVDSLNIFVMRPGQKLVQLWHGAGAFKTFGATRTKTMDTKHARYTDVIVSSDACRNPYSKSFKIPLDSVKSLGVSRTDLFFDEKLIKASNDKVKRNFNIKKKLIIFMPTWRGANILRSNYNIDSLDFSKLNSKLGKEYVFGIKLHPVLLNNKYVVNKIEEMKNKYPGFIIDFNDYDSTPELLMACDHLVSDYSSLIFEYSILNKPITYFVEDLEEYTSERSFLFNFNEYIFGTVTKTTDQLIKSIIDNKFDKEKRDIFYAKFMSSCDGNSTKRTVDLILKK